MQNENNMEWNPPKILNKDLIMDSYRKSRGGNAEMITIYCAECNSPVLYYQKDGKGALFRCYIDRIIYPYQYNNLLIYGNSLNKIPQLKCINCNNAIGTPMIYKKEKRIAFGLFKNRFYKRKSSKIK